jgi:hypothetical protein
MPELLPHPEPPAYRMSARAKRVWGKLQDWYGDALSQYGPFPPQDWCEVIDDLPNVTAERAALSEIRRKHVTFPPRFPEFESIVARASRPVHTGSSMQERLCAFVLEHRSLSVAQLRAPWSYLYRGHPGSAGDPKDGLTKPSIDFAVIGVVIPADGDHHPGYRVLAEDLALETFDTTPRVNNFQQELKSHADTRPTNL